MSGQCDRCGGWHTQPTACPALQPMTSGGAYRVLEIRFVDPRDTELDRLRRDLAEALELLEGALCYLPNDAGEKFMFRRRVQAFVDASQCEEVPR